MDFCAQSLRSIIIGLGGIFLLWAIFSGAGGLAVAVGSTAVGDCCAGVDGTSGGVKVGGVIFGGVKLQPPASSTAKPVTTVSRQAITLLMAVSRNY